MVTCLRCRSCETTWDTRRSSRPGTGSANSHSGTSSKPSKPAMKGKGYLNGWVIIGKPHFRDGVKSSGKQLFTKGVQVGTADGKLDQGQEFFLRAHGTKPFNDVIRNRLKSCLKNFENVLLLAF